jgi:hypothetical protein
MLLMAADIFSFVTVALDTDLARIATLEAELMTSMEALKDANAAEVSVERATKSAEPGLKRLKKLWLMLVRSKSSGINLWLCESTRFPLPLVVSVSSCP